MESLDAYYNASDGSDLGYPPIHPHHSNMIGVGYPLRNTYASQDGPFADWLPWPFMTTDYLAAGLPQCRG